MAKFHPSKNLIIGVVFALIVVTFAFQNSDMVTLRFVKWSFESSVAFIFVASVGFGILLSTLVAVPMNLHKSVQIASLKRKLSKAEGELNMKMTKTEKIKVEKLEKTVQEASSPKSE